MGYAPPHASSYAQLLGWYLGDGCVSHVHGSFQLVIICDAAYPGLIDDCWAALQLTAPDRRVYVRPHPRDRSVRIESSWKRWPEVFPQHGPGRKHERPIVLEPWQREVVDAHPWEFLRGLLHSDGCRTVNRFKTRLPSGRVAEYAYPRWFFSNLSTDIRELFCEYCDRVGVRWTQSNHRNISISHRRSVALVDAHIGAKG
jgi:hypothetical protein